MWLDTDRSGFITAIISCNSCMTLVRRYFICAVLRSTGTRAELVVCGRAVMRDVRPWLFIFVVLSAVLRSGFRDTDPNET